jgi:hypothetical protein
MNRTSLPRVFALLVVISAFCIFAQAQQVNPGVVAASNAQTTPPNVISFSDTLTGQPDGAITATFALYPDPQSTTPAWTETQAVQVSQGKYTVLLGAATTNGIPADIFAADQAHWLGVQINGTEKRYLLVSVPYAMKAMEAERLGGLLPSQFVTAAQLQAALQSTATSGPSTTTSGVTKTTSGPVANASLSPPQPATDFTDNNTTEILLVTQQGTGFAIHAISAGDAALFGENTTPTGTAVKALASGTSGANIGLLAQSASPTGIAGVFDNTGNGQILSLRNNGNEVASVDNTGSFKANQINATSFSGSGAGLFGIPPVAVGAQSGNVPNAIVVRDFSGSFSANQINATSFSGSGAGLFGIPPVAVGAQSDNVPNAIVVRDFSGSFSANQINATMFSGSGAGLFGIPPVAVGAQSGNVSNAIVVRDFSGSFSANQINATMFSGSGAGLFAIPPVAVGAQSGNVQNAIVVRDFFGNFSANQINANSFVGGGFGLTNIPNSATTATEFNFPSTIVTRDANGGFVAGFVQVSNLNVMGGMLTNSGQTDFSTGTITAPVRAVLSANTPTSCWTSRELLIKTDATPGQQLFICNATGNGYVLVGDGSAAGVTSVGAGDGSVAIGGTAAAPTVAVANGGITSAKLAANSVTGANIAAGSITNTQLGANSVTAANIADGSLPPTKIAGTVATLGSNTFTADQTIQTNLTVKGTLTNNAGLKTYNIFVNGSNPNIVNMLGSGSALIVSGGDTGISISGAGTALSATASSMNTITAQNTIGTGVQGIGPVGVDALTVTGVGLQARVTGSGGTAATFTNANPGKLISGRLGLSVPIENFSVDTSGNLFAAGGLITQFPNDNKTAGTTQFMLAGLTPAGAAVQAVGETGIIGIVVGGAGTTGNAQVAYGGIANCAFINATVAGDYVQNAGAGLCEDVGSAYPTSGQVVGRALATNTNPDFLVPVLLYGPEQRAFPPVAGVTSVSTGNGLAGGPITSTGTISIAKGGVTNAMLQNSAVTINPGTGLSGGGSMPLGGSVTLNNTGVLSFLGRAGSVLPAANDYSFSQLSGAASPSQLPATIVYNNTNNSFTGRQVITGTVGINDLSASSGGTTALAAFSQNNVAGSFLGGGPFIFVAQSTTTGGGINVAGDGTLTASGNVFGGAFIGDGSRLTNVNAASVGGVTSANLATTSALASEASSRQSADASLATSISAETAARQTDTSNLQTSINNVSAADAKLASANTFTASNIFTGGTQDFSAAGATLPVRALPIAQTPATCVASKELLIKTDAPAGQQLFLCDAGGTTWNLVGDGASGGVTSFNGRNGTVSPASGDYAFGQISGSVAASQLPALTGDVTEAAGSGATVLSATGVTAGTYIKVTVDQKGRVTSGAQASFSDISGTAAQSQLPALTGDVTEAAGSGVTVLAATGVTAGTYSKVTVDQKGRVTSGAQAGFSDIAGAAAQSQLPANVVYNNQSNTFSANQTVNGSLTAASFTGNGGGLSNVNAAALNGLASTSFAQLSASSNTFTGGLTAASFTGNGSALTNVNAATINNFQMLKLTASITPATVNHQTCGEQSFTVSGVNSSDVLLSVQPSGHSPGTNIAIGGWRVSANNTVAIQFCNVGSGTSTPAAATYTFSLMR